MSQADDVAHGEWAWAYDALYAARGMDRAAEVRQVLDVAADLDFVPSSVLDVACGTGAHLAELVDHVDEVMGVDRSPQMLDLARARLGPDVHLELGDMRTIDLGRRFDLVTCLFSSIAFAGTPVGLRQAIAAMAGHVMPGGLLVVQPWITPDAIVEGGIRDVTVADVDGTPVTRVVSSRWDGEALHLAMAYTAALGDGEVRTGLEHLRMICFTRDEHLTAFRDAGLIDVDWIDGRDSLGRGLVVGRQQVRTPGRRKGHFETSGDIDQPLDDDIAAPFHGSGLIPPEAGVGTDGPDRARDGRHDQPGLRQPPIEHLWAPWRHGYLADGDPIEGCPFCVLPARGSDRDRESLIIHRGEAAFVIMNAWPYSPGHLMVIPYQHTGFLRELPAEVSQEIWALGQTAAGVLHDVLGARGVNLGMNLGAAAGAGIAEHLHLHAVPRWPGDTNFMTTTASARVLPQALADLWEPLAAGFDGG